LSDLRLVKPTPRIPDPADYVGPVWDFGPSAQTDPGLPGTGLWGGSANLQVFPGPTTVALGITGASSWFWVGTQELAGTLFSGTAYPIVRMRVRALVRPTPGVDWAGWFYWGTESTWTGSPGSPDSPFDIPDDGGFVEWDEPAWPAGSEWVDVVFDLRDYPEKLWLGERITHLRFDFSRTSGDVFEIDFVRLESPTPEAANVDLLPVTTFDIQPDPTDGFRYEETSTLETAIRLSLFCDARAQEGDELPSGDGAFGEDLRGWWGSAYLSDDGELGSRLWTLKRSALTLATRQRARDYVLESLQWLIDLGIARAIECETTVVSRGVLEIDVEIEREDDTPARFSYLWEAL